MATGEPQSSCMHVGVCVGVCVCEMYVVYRILLTEANG